MAKPDHPTPTGQRPDQPTLTYEDAKHTSDDVAHSATNAPVYAAGPRSPSKYTDTSRRPAADDSGDSPCPARSLGPLRKQARDQPTSTGDGGCRSPAGDQNPTAAEGQPITRPTGSVWAAADAIGNLPLGSSAGFDERALTTIAWHATEVYSQHGDIVLDPQCDNLSIVGTAAAQKRLGIGIVSDSHSASLLAAEARRRHLSTIAFRTAESGISIPLRNGRQHPIPVTQFATLAVVTAKAAQPHGKAKSAFHAATGELVTKPHRDFLRLLRECHRALRPDGVLIVYAPRHRVDDELVDVPGMTVAALRRTGFIPIDRRAVVLNPTPDAERATRSHEPRSDENGTTSSRNHPRHRRIHEDLIIAVIAE